MMATMTCPAPYKEGTMTCWDNTQIPNTQSCPTMPTTETACKAVNKNWCVSTYSGGSSGSGWCSANSCMSMPPAGQMTCPDGKSFGKVLTDCPKGTTVIPTPEPKPEPKPEPTPEKDCLAANGKWCKIPEGSSTSSLGYYCLYNAGVCPTKQIDIDGKFMEIERQKKEILQKLAILDPLFRKYNDTVSLQKLQAFTDRVQGVSSANKNVFDDLVSIRADVAVLQQIGADLARDKNISNDQERDSKQQARALAQIKRAIAPFSRSLAALTARIARMKKDGVVVQAALQDAITKAQTLAQSIANATSFDAANDAATELRDVAGIINDDLPELEELARLPRLFKVLDAQLVAIDRRFKRDSILVSRLKLDMKDELYRASLFIASAKSNLAKAKSGVFDDQNPSDFLADNVNAKVEMLNDQLGNIEALVNLRKEIFVLGARTKNIDAQIKRWQRRGEDVEEAQATLRAAKEQYAKLAELVKQKLTSENALVAVDLLRQIDENLETASDLLNLNSASIFEQELKRTLPGSEDLQSFELPDLQSALQNANHISLFFRTGHTGNGYNRSSLALTQ